MNADPLFTRRLSRRDLFVVGLGVAGMSTTIAGVSLSLLTRPSLQSRLLFTYRTHTSGTFALAWSPDGTRIASISRDKPQGSDGIRPVSPWDVVVQVWDATSGQQLVVYRGHRSKPSLLSWSPDSTRLLSSEGHLLSSDGNEAHVWRASDGQLIWKAPAEVAIAPWSPDGSRIVVQEVKSGHRYAYDTQTWTPLPLFWPASFGSFAWSPDGSRIVGGYTSTDTTTPQWSQFQRIGVWSASSGVLLWNIVSLEDLSYLRGLVWSPDGTRIASCGTKPTVWLASNGGVRIWDAITGKRVLTYTGHDQSVDLQALAWSPNGKYIASGGSDNLIQVWDAATGDQLLTYQGHHDQVTTLTWSPDSTRIASGDFSGPIQVWQISP